MKKPIFMSVAPDNTYYVWENEVNIQNNIDLGLDNEMHFLWFLPHDRLQKGWNPLVLKLKEKYKDYKNIKFFYFTDVDDILNKVIRKINYIPYLRPYCLEKHFRNHPELKNEIIYYHDSDALFIKPLDFSKFNDLNTCYLSDTAGYLNLQYLDGKIEESKNKEQLKKIKPIDTLLELNNINRTIATANNSNTGGAQYLLRNIDADFWKDVMESCKIIRSYLRNINREFYKNENEGYQSWCADMWAVLWNIWKRGMKTECPKEMDFVWATDPIEKIDTHYIFHNAGVSSKSININGEKKIFFNKGDYKELEKAPYNDDFQLKLVDKNFATFYYANKLLNLKTTGIINN